MVHITLINGAEMLDCKNSQKDSSVNIIKFKLSNYTH